MEKDILQIINSSSKPEDILKIKKFSSKIKSKKMSKCTIGRRLDEFPEKWKK